LCRSVRLGVVCCSLFLLALPCAAVAAKPVINEPAPDFALKSSTGRNLRLSEYRGDVVLLNFWTKSCGRCREQLDQLEALYQAHRDAGFTVISVAVVDHPHDAQEIADSLRLSFPILYDDRKTVAQLYDPRTLPLTVLIDAHGQVREIYRRYRRGDEATYGERLTALLAEK
jgi:peroxiredoxin